MSLGVAKKSLKKIELDKEEEEEDKEEDDDDDD